MIGIIALGLILVVWIAAVTTETGRTLTMTVSHFLGITVLIGIMMLSLVLALRLALSDIGA